MDGKNIKVEVYSRPKENSHSPTVKDDANKKLPSLGDEMLLPKLKIV